MARLENWILCEGINVIIGDIYDDEQQRFEDGKAIRTSGIVELNLEENYAQTRNTKYILGKRKEM